MDRAEAEQRDAADPLFPLRDRFLLPDGLIYLDGNSLGALPAAVPERVARTVTEEWGVDLIRAWNARDWVGLPRRVGARIARLIGADPDSVVVCDSTSVNLFKLASAAIGMRPSRRKIVTDAGNFPTDLYILAGVAERHGLELVVAEPGDVLASIDGDSALVALTQVDYRTGDRYDMGIVTEAAHRAGALVLWDLAHSAGAFSVAVGDADLAVGCGYKYLNGGPGAPSFIYVAPHLQERFDNPIRGWFGHARPFAFDVEFEPVAGIDRTRVGTPHILSLAALDAALDAFEGVDMGAVTEKSQELTSLFMDLVESRLGRYLTIVTNGDPERRGSQVSLTHPQAFSIVSALIERGVIGDFREPDVARFGFAPLYVRHVDAYDAVEALVRVMSGREFEDPRHAVRRVVT